MKSIYVLAATGWVIAGVLALASYAAQDNAHAASNGAPTQEQVAAAMAAMNTDDWRDLYDRANEASTAWGNLQNVAYAMQQGTVNGTTVQLTLEQRNALAQKALDLFAASRRRGQEAYVIAGVTAGQVDTLANTVPARLTRAQQAAAAATAKAASTSTSP
jgi:cobalamin biosynthesis protein CobD/CbiB